MNYRVSAANGREQPPVPPTPHTVLQFFHHEEKKLFKRRKKVAGLRRDNAHVELLPPLILAQLISLFPIDGICGPDINCLKFRWISLKMAYCFLILCFQVMFWVGTVRGYFINGFSYSNFGDILFYGGSTCMSFVFLRLARGWKEFMGQWLAVQEVMNDLKEHSVRKKIMLITIWLALSSVSEHVLANTESVLFWYHKENRLQQYLLERHQEVFRWAPYSVPLGLFVHFTKFIITMIWNYTDIFLTSVSLALGKMFKQFSLDLELTSKAVSPETSLNYWRKRREIYSRLSLLTKLVDEKFSILVLYSFGINLYYICVQLLHTLRPLKTLSHLIYFGGSFGHLLCRTCAVCFSASCIYENSKEPLSVIFSVPSDQFNIEVQRLQMQISSETLALTGCRFFTVTRTLMLTIAGTIVTYEIVLYQFSGLNDSNSTSSSTSVNNLNVTEMMNIS